MFKPEKYTPPKFDREPFISFPDVTTEKAGDGYIPENFYATTIYPEYFKINGEWKMLTGSRMDCSVVIKDGMPYAVEMRNIKKGDEVVVNRTDDGRDGIFVHADGFSAPENSVDQAFAFRMGQSRETSYSRDYDRLYDILRHDRDHGKIVWVLGPACVFDHDSRAAMESLINNGYCDALFAGNALATHDLEGDLFHTGLGQDIYTKHNVPNGHYHHLHTIATGNMTPSYQVVDGVVRPVYFYVVDVSEFAVNKLKDRGSLSITGVVTNIQDFIVNAERNLIGRDGK